ncbi:MAG: ATP-binding cassette domain-containing protein [Candidatus Bathyarchaeota archaeon]|nr:ATP-binding cassette domain-containing protein [Candidatus Bathyarchaeota archaeon]
MNSVLKAQGLTKQYANILAVDRLDLEVFEGEIFGLLGPNGAGKTTTIRMLTGQIAPTSGTATIANHDIIHDSTKAKLQIGVVPDTSNVYDEMSAWDNLIFAAQLYSVPKIEREQRAKELLELFELYERRKDRIASFSRGMKRRITIAAALIHKPKLLFLDEPTSGLDVQSLRMIRTLIKELNGDGVTIFLTTHYIEEADQLCQRIAIINKGKIVTVDNPEKLKASVEKRQAIEVSFSISSNLKDKLKGLRCVNDVSVFGDKCRLGVEDASEAVPSLVDFARQNNLKIISINTLKPTLEDAFVKLTGLSSEAMTTEKEPVKKKEE